MNKLYGDALSLVLKEEVEIGAAYFTHKGALFTSLHNIKTLANKTWTAEAYYILLALHEKGCCQL